jgi:raffinose/stachyose/melibiose transport system substrate-binding protein
MKKLLAIALVALMALLPILSMAEGVELTMGSWRTDDTEKVNALLEKYFELTGVRIVFQPTTSTQYNATLRQQLDGGIGPDLFYSRSYSTGAELCENGFNVLCNDIPGVKENFTESALSAFTDAEGHVFAVPFAAVSHFVYYNKAIFADNGIEVPTTFEEFLNVCETLKGLGIQPLSNGIAANWDILECVLCGMIPNYITAEERLAYESGEKKMNDETWIRIYSDFAKLVPYFPEAFASIDNDQANVMFGLGQSAMLIDGSWSYGVLAGDDYDIDVGFFPIPAPEGNAAGFSLHPDFGIAGNAASAHPEEVKAFLAWLASVEGATITASVIPDGFLPMINADVAAEGSIVAAMNAVGEGKNADMRFVWSKMMALYTPMVEQLNAICRGEQTPEGAANEINTLWEAELAK